MNKTEETRDFISGWESRVSFELSGEPPFGLIFSDDLAAFSNLVLEDSDVVFFGDSDLFYKLITGREDQDEAFSNGLVEVKGSIFDSVKFRHAAEITQKNHNALFATLRALARFT